MAIMRSRILLQLDLWLLLNVTDSSSDVSCEADEPPLDLREASSHLITFLWPPTGDWKIRG